MSVHILESIEGAHLNDGLGDFGRGEYGVRGNHSVREFLDERVRNKALIDGGLRTSLSLESNRLPRPAPVPPPKDCRTWNPWSASHFSDCLRTISRIESTSSAP